MEKRIINPWQWQDQRSYVQAVEVKQAAGTLYCSGQAAEGPRQLGWRAQSWQAMGGVAPRRNGRRWT